MTSNIVEARLTKKCADWLKSQSDIFYFKVAGSPVQKGGIPDYVICKNGRFIAIELKREDGKGAPSRRQEINCARIREAGGTAEIVDSFERFKELVND